MAKPLEITGGAFSEVSASDDVAVGTLTVDTGSTTSCVSLKSGSTASVSDASTGRLRYNESTQKFQTSENGGAYADIGGDRTASGLRTATTVVSVSAATAPSTGQVLTATSSTAATWQAAGGGDTLVEWAPVYPHNSDTKNTASSTYIVGANFIFRGSSEVGTPTSMKAVGYVSAGTGGAIRVYDVTNSQTIAELTGISTTTKSVLDLGSISNIPTGAAVFELQWKGDGTNPCNFGGVSIRY